MPIQRRHCLLTPVFSPLLSPLLWAPSAWASDLEDAVSSLRAGGAVAAFRHTLAPGTFDPPQFKLGDCSTQRNLSDDGRAQASRLGAWFSARQLRPARVRSSPWCRCVDTAWLAFDRADLWPALGSPTGQSAQARTAQQDELRVALQKASARRGEFEVWVTHMFVMNELAQVALAAGEGLVLRADTAGAPQVLARIMVA